MACNESIRIYIFSVREMVYELYDLRLNILALLEMYKLSVIF